MLATYLGFFCRHLGSVGILALSAWVFGETLLRCRLLATGRPRSLEHRLLAPVLGLGVIAQTLFFLGLLNLLEQKVVVAALAAGHLGSYRTWSSWFGHRKSVWCFVRRVSWTRLAGIGSVVVVLVPGLVLAFYPPTGFDATMYHLPFARSFAEAGGLPFLPDLRVPVFPVTFEMLFVPAFFLSGDVAAKLTQFFALLLTAALTFAWGQRRFSRQVGLWAAALWLGVPLVVYLGSSAYIDVGLTLFVTAAFISWERWQDDSREDRGDDGDRSWRSLWLVLAGVFAGLAASAKYVGLVFCVALLGLTVLQALRIRALRPVVIFSLAAALVAGPCYLRILYYTGNPVFPFFASVFGESEWTVKGLEPGPDPVSDPDSESVAGRAGRRLGRGVKTLLLVPWTGVFDRAASNYQSPLSPYYLVLIPFCLPLCLAHGRTRRYLLLALAYGLFWSVTFPGVRYLLPVLPFLHLCLAHGLVWWSRLVWARQAPGQLLLWCVAIGLLAPGPLYAVYKVHEQGALPVTVEERKDYLSAQVPGYAAIRWLNTTAESGYTVYALYGERLPYYASGRYVGDYIGPMRYSRILAVLENGEELFQELRRTGAGYFLVVADSVRERLPKDAFFEENFHAVVIDSHCVLYQLRSP